MSKLGKLINNPKLFFKDMVRNQLDLYEPDTSKKSESWVNKNLDFSLINFSSISSLEYPLLIILF